MPARAIYALFLVLLVACGDRVFSESDASSPSRDGDASGPPLPSGAYVVEGAATLATGRETTGAHAGYARFVLYVEDGVPSYFRDESFGYLHGRLYDLSFDESRDVSELVQLRAATGTCTMRMSRDGCALLDFDGCFRIDPRSDQGPTLTGSWSACSTDEHVVRTLELVGAYDPRVITPDGAARLMANYRLDPTADAIEVLVNGEVREVSWTPDADADSAVVELGPVPPNAELTVTHRGTRDEVDFAHATPFETTADADLTLSTLLEGSLDARGEPVTLVDGTLEVRRTSSTLFPFPRLTASAPEIPLGSG